MPRVDQRFTYTRLPQNPSAAFPGLTEVWSPLVEIVVGESGRGFRTKALLDTGAVFTFFPTQYADALNLDWRIAPQTTFVGVGGGQNTGYVIEVDLHLVAARYTWPVRVVFSPAMDPCPLPLLGHVGFFEHFEVRFKTAALEFRVFLK